MMVRLVTTACTCNRLRQSILSGPPFFPSALFRIIAKILIAIRRPHLIWGVCESSLPRHVANTIIQFKKFIRFWNVWHAQSVHWPLWSKHLLNYSSLGSELVGKVILLPRVFILSLFSISTSQILVAILWPHLGHPTRRWKWAQFLPSEGFGMADSITLWLAQWLLWSMHLMKCLPMSFCFEG